MDAEVIVVGAGLAGLVATAELADAGRRVLLLEQEPPVSLGGQAFWSGPRLTGEPCYESGLARGHPVANCP